ncbi:MAG TPA: hypothetical protein VG870_06910 [Chitinophagaceae bacterium]|nr:hypothetical protein [Chitinophagaceae bacterium]
MKKIWMVALGLVMLPSLGFSQITRTVSRRDSVTSGREYRLGGVLTTFAQMDQRKIYYWHNGQRSTPTGRQAGEELSPYVLVYGDSARVVRDPSVYLNRGNDPGVMHDGSTGYRSW